MSIHSIKRYSYAGYLLWNEILICDALRDLVPFVQFKKLKNTNGEPASLLKLTLLHECFSRFLNWYQIPQRTTYVEWCIMLFYVGWHKKIYMKNFFFLISILNIYTSKHKIYNYQSYMYLICLGPKKNNKKTKTKKQKKQ